MSWTYSLFVSTQYIKDNSPVIDYVSDDELQPFIKIAQDTAIQKVMGTNLFKDLQNKILLDTLNSDEETLMNEYVQPATVHCTVYEYLLYSHYKFTNKGITKQNSTDSTSADLNEVNFVRDDVRNKAEYFKDRLSKHLLANATLFPMFYGGTTTIETILPSFKNYYSGIYTGKRRGYKGCRDCGPGEVGPGTWIDLNW